ncbi:MFS transporter, partial [Stenotrophomonas maltophilia]
AALVGGASALLGGAIADRMAKRYGLHAQAWVIAAMKAIAFPFAVSFYFFDSVPVALGAYFVSLLFAGVYLGPTYALIQ